MEQGLENEAVFKLLQQELPVLGVKRKGFPGVCEGFCISTQSCLGKLRKNILLTLWAICLFSVHFLGIKPMHALNMLGKCSNTEPHSSCLAKTLNSINLNESNKQQRRNFIDLILDWRRWIRGTFRRGPVVISQAQSVCILKSLLVSDKQGLLCLGH